MALNREQRRALLKQSIAGEDDVEVDQLEDDPPSKATSVTPAAAPTQAMTLSVEQLQAIVTAAVQAAGSAGGDVGAQISRALRDNRQPIPENTDAQYHRKSHYHPAGTDAPRAALDHDLFLGVWDMQSGKAVPKFPIDEKMSTDDEIVALNSIVPGTYEVQRNDGVKTLARVVDVKDGMDNVLRRVIAFPLQQFEKEHRNTLPPLVTLAQQLVEA